METSERYENYPVQTVVLSNLVSLGIYGLGLFIMQKTGWIPATVYLIFILLFEYRLIRYHCTNCYYWGRLCGFGRGRISGWFFRQGDPSTFCRKKITLKDMIPDALIALIPLVSGIVLLILEFSLTLLFALLVLVVLTTMGNAHVRGRLTCRHCRQQELGCPADALFNKNKNY